MMPEFKDWVAELGAALINPGAPVGFSKAVTDQGLSAEPTPHPLSGFSILQASDMEQALNLCKLPAYALWWYFGSFCNDAYAR